jgi:hypothetical protein
MKTRSASRGLTLLELVIATFLALIVVLAMGKIILVNNRAWEWGRDKSVLQANETEALEWMARSIRAANHLRMISASEFRTYDAAGTLLHTYRRQVVSGLGRLQQDGTDLVARQCTQFVLTPDNDTTSLTIRLELQDNSSNKISATTRAAVRNRAFEF